ncbi:hypothetical protein L6164_037017 [Bauhinia variegata]|uniref:Uncharacterized protein n=1 Tax=Bauhinia variegata TaxID=167791 RepID=A0ACB9KIT7_BAUVA|nr:hypothetical protein L6164_037017 [Bauhinia variegata]
MFMRSCRVASLASTTSVPPPESSSLLHDFTHFCYQRDLPRAMQALDAMESHGLPSDAITYSELVKCCLARRAVTEGKRVHKHIFSNGYGSNTFLINVLMNMYVKFNLLEEAQLLFDEMSEKNVVSWTTIISAYSNSKLNDKALDSLILMLREGVKPNMFTYSSVLRACERLSHLRQLHSSIMKVGLESDVFVRSALIDVYSKLGELREALNVFREMVTGDSVVWNSIIGAFAQHSDGDEALYLYQSMRRAGFPADQSTLTSVLRACTSMSLLELGRQVHVHVLKFDQDLILNNALLDMYYGEERYFACPVRILQSSWSSRVTLISLGLCQIMLFFQFQIYLAGHGPDCQQAGFRVVLVIAGDGVYLNALQEEFSKQRKSLSRGEFASKSLSHSFIVYARDMLEVSPVLQVCIRAYAKPFDLNGLCG